jgi:LuxR family transcriptional activator of bioluminescence operon
MKKIQEIILELSSINQVEEVGGILQNRISEFNMEYFLFGMASPSSITKTSIVIEDNFPKSWRDYYDSNSLAKIDPIVNYCLKNYSPINWAYFQEKNCSPEEINLFKKAKECGLAYGFSIPIHGSENQFGMLSMAASIDKTPDELFVSIMMAQTIIPAIQDALNRFINPRISTKVKLTPREIECLKWASEGKSGWDMSKIMDCTERTILFHMNNAGKKLNANNRTQSIAKAILLGYLKPSLDY